VQILHHSQRERSGSLHAVDQEHDLRRRCRQQPAAIGECERAARVASVTRRHDAIAPPQHFDGEAASKKDGKFKKLGKQGAMEEVRAVVCDRSSQCRAFAHDRAHRRVGGSV